MIPADSIINQVDFINSLRILFEENHNNSIDQAVPKDPRDREAYLHNIYILVGKAFVEVSSNKKSHFNHRFEELLIDVMKTASIHLHDDICLYSNEDLI